MDHALLAELFRCARNYHGALADYAATMRDGGDIERPAQHIIGTSLRYRIAIDRLLESDDWESLGMVASRGRLERMRRILVSTSRRYNLLKAAPRRDLVL
jgi:hypothetical protein